MYNKINRVTKKTQWISTHKVYKAVCGTESYINGTKIWHHTQCIHQITKVVNFQIWIIYKTIERTTVTKPYNK